jgi:hypothetical protein
MKIKLILVVTMLAVVLVAGRAAPLQAVCSGDDCGCYTPQKVECDAACPPVGDPSRPACLANCSHEAKCCAEICCGACPLQCGCIGGDSATLLQNR